MKFVAKDIGIAWGGFCLAIAVVCGVLTFSVWNALDAPPFGKFLIALLMTSGLTVLSLTLVTSIKARGRDVGNIWRFGLNPQPDENELISLWRFSRVTMVGWGVHIFLFSCFALYLRSHAQK